MPKNVLIIDDAGDNRHILSETLRKDYDIHEAENGREGLEVLRKRQGQISAVLLDILMPVMDGFEVLAAIREDSSLAQIPVIVMTSSSDEETEVKALSLGANDFIAKPFKPDIVRHCLRNAINLCESASVINALQKDKLTGLCGREAFFEAAGDMIKAGEPGYYVLSCLDIDNFKVINDLYGSVRGDGILKHVARTLAGGVAPLGGICGRIAADSFAALYPRRFMDSAGVERIRERAAVPEGLLQPLSVSVGRYIVTDRDLAVNAMYDRALLARNSVKGRFDVHVALYDESMRDQVLQEQEIVDGMKDALARKQFELWFQPQFNHASGALVGAEALVRWRHPRRGLLQPGAFIPLFEQNGFIYEMDKFVWERSCQFLRKWTDEGRRPLPLSVNVSRYDLLRGDLADQLTGLLEKYGLPVELLRLEITESAFAKSANQIIEAVKSLIGRGFTVEIDDFGSGYSSLNTLKDVPAHVLKLDMRFMDNRTNSTRGGNILESVVRLAKWLGMAVVAEGVELKEQADYLKSIGCSYIQGYLYARPMPAEEYEALAGKVGREERLLGLETVETLDNSAFWDPRSMDTLIFNSYVGGACIMEYHGGRLEMLRANEKYAQVLGGLGMTVEDAFRIQWEDHLDGAGRETLFGAAERAARTGEEVAIECAYANLVAGQETTWLRSTLRAIARTGDRALIYCIDENITSQREAERKEHRLSEQLSAIMGNVGSGVTAVTFDEGKVRYIFVNDRYYEILGYTRQQYQDEIGNGYCAVHPEDWQAVREKSQAAVRTGAPSAVEYRVARRDGREIWVRQVFSMTRFTGVDAPVQLGVMSDITAEKRVELESLETAGQLRLLNAKIESDNRTLQGLMNDTPGGFARVKVRPGGRWQLEYVNDGLCLMLGTTRKAVLEQLDGDAMAALHPDDAAPLVAAYERAEAGDGRVCAKCRLRHRDGRYLWFQVFARSMRSETGESFFNAYFTDLSEQEKKEMAFREMLPVALAAMMSASADLSFVKDRQLRYICCSRAFAKMVGLESEKDVAGKTDYDLFEKDLAEQYRADDSSLMERGEPLVDYVERIPSGDGIVHYSRTSKYLLYDSSGSVIGFYGTGRDITENLAADARLKLFIDSPPCGIAMFELSSGGIRTLYYSDGFYNFSGYGRDEFAAMVRRGAFPLVAGEDLPGLLEAMETMKNGGTPLDCCYRCRTKEGRLRWFNLRGMVTERHGDRAVVNAVQFDVTEQKAAQEAALVHEREMRLAMSQMGRMLCEYDPAARTLAMPGAYAARYALPEVLRDVPGCLERSGMGQGSPAAILEFYEAIRRGDSCGGAESCLFWADGTKHWEHAEFAAIRDSGGKTVKALITVEDTTQQHLDYELEQGRPHMGEANLLVHALFNLSSGETLEYAYADGSGVPLSERLAFVPGQDNLDVLLISGEERERYRALNDRAALLDRFAKGETEFSIDYRRRMRGGQVLWTRNILRMLRQPGGSDVLLFEYCYDVEEQKMRELMYHSLVNDGYDYVIRVDGKNGRFSSIVRAGLEGAVPPAEGGDFDALIRALAAGNVLPEDQEMAIGHSLLANVRENLKAQERFQFTCRKKRPDGSISYKKLTQYYLDREREIIVVNQEDISALVLEERRKNEALGAALQAAKQASRAKSQFLSRMSHELRTPMNAIIGFSALSALEVDNPKAVEDSIGKIGQAARYLLSLINDILEMSRIESGRVTLSEAPFDFGQFISGVNAIIFSQASGKGVDYDAAAAHSMEPVYVGDAVKLQEILVNVLGNSVKFTPPGGKITFTMEQLRRTDKHAVLRFRVSDTGVGIDEKFLPCLFDPFTQEAGGAASPSGTGLGLAITKNLVEMMNGQIEVQSVKNVGSTFTVDVQLGVSEESRQYFEMLSSMNLSKFSALVVDDDAQLGESAKGILSAMGMRAEWAGSGRRAVERVAALHGEKRDFDMIFVDWKMPGMDGIETTRQIRKIVGPKVTIIIMTAYDWKEIEARARGAGVDLFMEKPLFQSSVVKAFEKVFAAGGPKARTAPPESFDFTGRRILLVEDNPINAEVARRLLEKTGAEVVAASNGQEAMETFAAAEDDFFDAILMDVRMPVMDGLTATRNIRKLKKKGSGTVPIIAMTANAFEEDVEQSLSSGMNAHLAKPIEPRVLFAAIKRFLAD